MESTRWKNIALVLTGIVAGCAASEAHEMVTTPPINVAHAQSPTSTYAPTTRPPPLPPVPRPTARPRGSAYAYSQPAPMPPYPNPRKVKRWQLHCVKGAFDEAATLQRYGAAGWELIGPGQYNSGYCFKRPAR